MFKTFPNKRDLYVPRLIEPNNKWVTRGSKDKSLFPSHLLVMTTCCVICYGPYRICLMDVWAPMITSSTTRSILIQPKEAIFPSSSNCVIIYPIIELLKKCFSISPALEQLLRHQFVRYKYKFAFGLNSRRNIRSCMFPHQIVAFQLKKNISSCEDELSILSKSKNKRSNKNSRRFKSFFSKFRPWIEMPTRCRIITKVYYELITDG